MKKLINNTFANAKNSSLIQGVSSKWFLRHFPLIVIGIFFALAYISVRFDCITAMETVKHLETRLETVRTETRRERAKYMSATSEASMLQMVDTLNLGLRLQDQPPFIIAINQE